MARGLELPRAWEFEVAARLSQIGWLLLPTETHEAAWRVAALARTLATAADALTAPLPLGATTSS